MKECFDFLVQRGDRRQSLLCDLLIADGHNAQLVSAPEQWGRENLPPPGAFLVAAKADPALREAAADNGFILLEYGKHPLFHQENGRITAENALQVAMKHRLCTLRDSSALVIGYGGIGRPLAALLKAMECRRVGVAIRREEQLWVLKGEGYRSLLSRDLEQYVGQYDVIFNTVPQCLLTRAVLEQLAPGALVVDLASQPGGVEWDAAREMGLKALQALALPGKLTPASAAVAIKNTVYALCKEATYER